MAGQALSKPTFENFEGHVHPHILKIDQGTLQFLPMEVSHVQPFNQVFCFLNIEKRYLRVSLDNEIVENHHSMTSGP
jgi:hypothetical protein